MTEASGFGRGFSKAALAQASKIPMQLLPEERMEPLRRDLRTLPFVTIDGEDAKDFDDAVYVACRRRGFRLWVAVSDVAHYVPEGSALDKCAQERATSVYLANGVLPMLPERLSNGLCSLLPGEERLVLVAEMVFSEEGHFLETEVYPAVIKSAARLTYEEVQRFFNGDPPPHLHAFLPMLQNARVLASRLHALRIQRGALEMQVPERRLECSLQGEPLQIRLRHPQESHRLIESFMVCANEAVARYAVRRALPVLFRCHGQPDERKLQLFSRVAKSMGAPMGKPGPHEFNRMLNAVRGTPQERFLGMMLLRSMSQAVYSEKNEGHYGLASWAYLHFTSPIRRYPDLWVHRILKAHWAQSLAPVETAALAKLARHCVEKERSAMQLERDAAACGSAYLAQKLLGKSFEATVVGFARMGCFLEIERLWIEGLIRTRHLGNGVSFDERNYCLEFPGERKLELGMRCTVRVCSAHVQRGQVKLKCLALPRELQQPKASKKSRKPLSKSPERKEGRA